jgi:hypothetical protein
MFLRDKPTLNLTEVHKKVDTKDTKTAVAPIKDLDLRSDPHVITITPTEGKAKVEVPRTITGIESLGNWLDVPTAFLHRLGDSDRDLQDHLLSTLAARKDDVVSVVYTKDGVREIRDPRKEVIEPVRVVEAAQKVLGDTATVIDFWTGDEFRLDAVAGDLDDPGKGFGWGGITPTKRRVGDLSAGGLRWGMDLKHRLAPWVQPYVYRLWCTNGCETRDDLLKVDARGQTVDEVIAEIEQMAQQAFGEIEHTIAHYYDLRDVPVENPERFLVRLADEQSMPPRTLRRLLDAAASDELPDNPSQFDLVNLVTNAANDPTLRNKTGARRALEAIGGSVITDHAARCGHCLTKLAD